MGKEIEFAENGSFALTKPDGSVQFARYTFDSNGNLLIGGQIVPATITDSDSTKILRLTTSVGTEVVEPCDGKEESKQETKKETKEEQKEQPKEQPKKLPEAPKST